MPRNFMRLIESKWKGDKFVCVGLDSDLSRIPEMPSLSVGERIFSFNQGIVDATHDLVCAYKPNAAFYEEHGDEGLRALGRTIAYINQVAPDVPVILDAKRADIGKTNFGYAKAAFDSLKADAITVNPYFGGTALAPFLERKDKGVIILCRTSNPGGGEFQDLLTLSLNPRDRPDGMSAEDWLETLCADATPLYLRVARNIANSWNTNRNCLLVVGATYPAEARQIRLMTGDTVPFLIPGVGTQGGDVEQIVLATQDSQGWGIVINSSSGVIFSTDGPRAEVQKLDKLINQHRQK